jgi:hypothetical protein
MLPAFHELIVKQFAKDQVHYDLIDRTLPGDVNAIEDYLDILRLSVRARQVTMNSLGSKWALSKFEGWGDHRTDVAEGQKSTIPWYRL